MYKTQLFFILNCLMFISCVRDEDIKIQAAFAPFNPETTPIRWSNSNIVGSLNLKVADTITDDFNGSDDDSSGRGPIEQMMQIWNESTSVYDFFSLTGLDTPNKTYSDLSDFKNDGEMGIYRADSWFSDVSSSALAITQTFGYRRNVGTSVEYVELTHADIIVNYDNYSFAVNGSGGAYDLKTVILHELGHFLGPRHNNDTSSIMYPSLGVGTLKRSLSSSDTSNIRSLYGASSLLAKSNSPSAFAQVMSHDREGEEVRMVIELRADGDCVHYENDKLVHTHSSK